MEQGWDFPHRIILLLLLFCPSFLLVMVWLRPATKVPHGRPSPQPGWKENGKKQAETGGLG